MGASVSFEGKHVVITGGSEGIGFALAQLFLGDGATVSLISRSEGKLRNAAARLKEAGGKDRVHTASADVGDMAALKAAMAWLTAEAGPVDVAIANAGIAIPKKLVDQTVAEAESTMRVNYWGCYHLAKLLLPDMLRRRAGHLCFVSSMVYVSPMAGFSSYAPTKAAVRHLADCLRSETQGSGVTVSVAYPPDTQTAGYESENACKAAETKAIADAFGDTVYSPEVVARAMFRGLKRGAYHLPNPDFLHQLGLSLVAALTPRPQWLVVEVLLAPLLVIVAYVHGQIQDRVVRRVQRQRRGAAAKGAKAK